MLSGRSVLGDSTDDPLTKIFNDPIHGHISLDRDQLRIMDTPQFQRLRDLKQLGSSCFVFLGASHNRFEHSVGVSFLADKMVNQLMHSQPELEIESRDIQCVKLAGLCHDLGHGPFSHVFDGEFIPRARPNTTWTHEKGSEMLLDYLIDANGIDMETKDVDFIKDLIQGSPHHVHTAPEKMFLFDIVANKRNSVDVDKFDYLQRDCHNIGIKSSYDCSRLIWFARVIENQICFSDKEVFNLYELFHTRYSLFKRVFTHKVGKAIELMIVDALLLADPYMNISDAIDSPEEYTYLTDSILKDIEKSKSEDLKPARGIIERIRKRQLYKFVEQYNLPQHFRHQITKQTLTPSFILRYAQNEDRLTNSDIILDWLSTNYGMKNENPLEKIKFFGKWKDNQAYLIANDQLNYIVPERYEEIIVRVFARNPEKVPAIQKAFRKCLKSFTRDVIQSLSVEHSPSRWTDDGMPDLNQPLTQLSLSSQVSPSRIQALQEYAPHPLNTVPSEGEWRQLATKRGWSPAKKTTLKVKSEKRSSAAKQLFETQAQTHHSLVDDLLDLE